MKYLLIFLAFSATTLYADTYQGKNGKAAHNRYGTAVQTSNGTAVHARGSSTVRSTNGAYHASGTNGAAIHTNNGTAIHTNANWNNAYWHSNRYGYWNGQRGYWNVVSGRHVFVVVN
jgi:nucleoside-specific outer membrane channel protein Tsx